MLLGSGFLFRGWVLDVLAGILALLRSGDAGHITFSDARSALVTRREESRAIHITLNLSGLTGCVAGLHAARKVAPCVSLNGAELAECQQGQGHSRCHAPQGHLRS